MQNSLLNQLNKLKQNQKSAPTLPYKAQSSLLFDFKYANAIDVETIYEIGYEGLIELSKIDENFTKYFKTLFEPTSKYYNREMSDSSEINKKDKELKQILIYLSKYFYNRNSHQVMEYLIKIYKVNIYLSEYFIIPFLCYYNNSIFIKMIQNINFKENAQFEFMEDFAKKGVLIYKNDIIKYLSDSTHFNFLVKIIDFYTKNISLTIYEYYEFILDIIEYKINNMESVKKDKDKNFFNILIKVINYINKNFNTLEEQQYSKYLNKYQELFDIILNKINLSNDIIKALTNDMIINIYKKCNVNQIYVLLTLNKILSKKFYENQINNESLYKKETIELLSQELDDNDEIKEYFNKNKKDTEYFIYELILENINDKNINIRPILLLFFEDIENIENLLILLYKSNKSSKQMSNIFMNILEDINQNNLNKAFIKLYKKRKINELPIKNDNINIYISLLSSSIPQVISALNQLNSDSNKLNDENIINSLASKFIFNDDEVVLNLILNLKNFEIKTISKEIFSFYINMLKNYNMNKYSESLKINIEKSLNIIFQNEPNIIFKIYTEVIFNKNTFKISSLENELISNKKIFIEQLIDLIKESKERNRGINIKNLNNYFEMYYKSEIIDEEELSLIETLLSLQNFYKHYDNLFSYALKGYIIYISKSVQKFSHIIKLYEIINNIKDNFNTFFNDLITTHFSNINQQQIFLAFLLLNKTEFDNKNKLLLEFTFDFLKNSKKEDFILSIALLFHLNEISLDSFSFYFNIKRDIIFNKLSCIKYIDNKKLLNINFSKSIVNNVKKLYEIINNDKNELKINKNYLRRLFESNLICLEDLYFLVNILLIDNEVDMNEKLDEDFIKIIIKILSLFTKNISFDINNKKNKKTFFDIIEKSFSIKNNTIHNILVKNFIIYYPDSINELIFFLVKLKNENKINNFIISEDIISILFQKGFELSSLKNEEEIFIIIKFCINNNISPYSLNIKPFEQNMIINYLQYIEKQFIELNKLDESQIAYFYKILLINPINVNKEILLKTFNILAATENININICYSIFSLTKNLENISDEEKKLLSNEFPKIIKKLISVLNLENSFNYEEEKKIQLILSSSNILCIKCQNEKSKKNEIILDSYTEVMNSNLSLSIKNEIFNIIFESILEYINQININNEEFYYEYIQTIIKHPFIEYNDKIIINLLNTKIIKNKDKAASFLFYAEYETFINKKNEVFNEIIYSKENITEYNLYEWMKNVENLLLLKNTQDNLVYELISNIIISLLKENRDEMDIENEDKNSSETILNIITILFNKNKNLSENIIRLAKKENLLSNLFITMYSIKDKYNKSKNYILSKIIVHISSKDDYLYEYILNNIIIENIEKKYENLIYIYQLMIKLASKKNNNILDLLKKSLDKILSTDLKASPSNKDSVFYNYYFTICKYFIHISNIYDMTLLSYFNKFIPFFIASMKNIKADQKKLKKINKEKNIEISLIKDNSDIIYEDLDLLTQGNLCNYLSPFINDLIEAIISLNLDTFKTILSRIASKNEFDLNFKAVISNKDKLNSLLLYYFQMTIESGDKLTFADMHKEIIKFFIQIMNNNQKFIKEITLCLNSYILKINEKQLKEIFSLLLSYINEKDENKEFILSNSIIVLQIFNTLLNVIHDIFVENYFTKYKNIIIQLVHLSDSFIFKEDDNNQNKLGKKHERVLEYNDDFNYLKLSTLLMENIKLNFKYSKGKLLVETQEELFDPIIEQYKLSQNREKMMEYYENSIKDCILEIFQNIQSDDLFKELNDELLNLIREDSYVTKLLVLKTITISLETLKERYLTLIGDIIPYISELLEDSNTEVKKCSVELLQYIEKLTGESYQSYLE